MTSASDLRQRIAEVSTAIVRQKQVLRDLENTKCDLGGRLNALLDPVTRFPLEISSDIFMLGFDSDSIPTPRPNFSPLVYLNVCRSWRDIALATPSLWSAIEVVGNGQHVDELVHGWFTRAGSRLLTISCYGKLSTKLLGAMHYYADRIQILDLDIPGDSQVHRIADKVFPSLSKLCIRQINSDDGDDNNHFFDVACGAAMLRAAPALIECKFSDIHYTHDSGSLFPSTHQNLKHLTFGAYPSVYEPNTATILNDVTLPALESLSITDFDVSHGEFVAFLTRSSPPLESLCMYLPSGGWSTAEIQSLCQVLPNLTQLDLRYNRHTDLEFRDPSDFIEALAEPSLQNLLPNLQTLTMREFPDFGHQYTKLVVALSSRRAQLRSFRYLPAYHNRSLPTAATLAALRELLANGMEIQIVVDGKDCISDSQVKY
ncbi:hypothetical protein C8R43DRAFT_121677 [Mycena crocata]|nr:hypothetical protein C8R43DRAFT_121677 [Mycena crocata]